jgi:hypothetical protein
MWRARLISPHDLLGVPGFMFLYLVQLFCKLSQTCSHYSRTGAPFIDGPDKLRRTRLPRRIVRRKG